MKKLMFTAATLVVLAGSTFSAIPSNTTFAGVTKPKTATPQPSSTPAMPSSIPPGCPYNDPNGCGILD